jgi:hypothetical protein
VLKTYSSNTNLTWEKYLQSTFWDWTESYKAYECPLPVITISVAKFMALPYTAVSWSIPLNSHYSQVLNTVTYVRTNSKKGKNRENDWKIKQPCKKIKCYFSIFCLF